MSGDTSCYLPPWGQHHQRAHRTAANFQADINSSLRDIDIALGGEGNDRLGISSAFIARFDNRTVIDPEILNKIRDIQPTIITDFAVTITVGITPVGVAITPDGNFAYVTNFGSNSVTVIGKADNTVTATVGVGTNPHGVAITPDGNFAYVANQFSENVSVIATASNTVAATITVGTWPVGVAITPDGLVAYVTNRRSNSVSVIATVSNTVTATVAVDIGPVGVAITP